MIVTGVDDDKIPGRTALRDHQGHGDREDAKPVPRDQDDIVFQRSPATKDDRFYKDDKNENVLQPVLAPQYLEERFAHRSPFS